MEAIVLLLGFLSAGTAASALVIRNFYHICQPSEVLIFAGSRRRTQEGEEGKEVGYRLVKGGSSIQVPVIERTFRMNLTNMIIDLKVVNAYSKGGIPLTVQGVANIKIAGEEPTIHNAIERLLGKSRKEIEQLAKETLEGTLRGVLASLTPEEANADQIAFAKILLEEAEDDLEQLGIVLDSLQIQNISDDVDYLDSIGRKQQAELLRDARIAEAKAKAESVINASENKRLVALRRIERDLEISKAEAERRVRDALTKRVAIIAEAESLVGAEIAKTQAQVAVQTERIKQVEHQLQADVIAPAEAESKRAISKAKADAASIVEDGKAQVEGIKSLAQSWKAAGSNAKDIFLLQKLDVLLQAMATSIPDVEVQNLTVIDSQSGSNATKMAAFVEQLRQTTGIDVNQLAQRFVDGKSPLASEKSALPHDV
ncbi:MAG: flotillin family protein [Scytonematopsis contorta HA4267-MV1]|nr:flotillin family protein [Scytonematopsis contorta HA4267-MV1]